MRILLEGEQQLRVQAVGAGLEVESVRDNIDFSPLHMLAASFATCTLSVLATWAMQASIDFDGLEIATRWDYVEDPYRVGRYDLDILWPGLPENRRDAALRTARHCTVEHTLTHPPTIEMRLEA